MRSRPVVALLALVLLAGCSSEVTGTALATGASTDADQAELDDLAGWRGWDPCGFLAPSAVAALGADVSSTSADDPSGCTVVARDAGGSVLQLVTVLVGLPHREGPESDETTDSVDGVTVYRSDDGPTACTAQVPLTSARVLLLTVNQQSESLGATACPVLDGLVRPAVAALDSPPEWGADASPVLTADPCAALQEDDGGAPGVIGTSLHRCFVTADESVMSVRFFVGPAGSGGTTVGGFDATVEQISDGDGCRVVVRGRASVDPLTDPAPTEPYVAQLEASTTDDFRPDTPAPTCDDALALAEAAVAASGLT